MVRAYGMDVVSHGVVPNDDNGYFLVRSFASLAELTAQEDEFYGSAPWREEPRESLVSRIDTCVDTLLWLSPAAIADLRAGNVPPLVAAGELVGRAPRARWRAGLLRPGGHVRAGVRPARARHPRAGSGRGRVAFGACRNSARLLFGSLSCELPGRRHPTTSCALSLPSSFSSTEFALALLVRIVWLRHCFLSVGCPHDTRSSGVVRFSPL